MARKLITADETTNELPTTAKFASGSALEVQVDTKVALKQDKGEYVVTTDPRLTDERTPKTHTHAVADVSGLQAELDGKASATHTQGANTISVVEKDTLTGITVQLSLEALAARIAVLENPPA